MSMSWKSFFKSMCMKALKRGSRRRQIKDILEIARKPIYSSKPTFELLEDRVVPSSFTAGNLVVLEAPNTSSDTTGSIIELLPSTANQSTPVQTIAVNNVVISGGAGTVGYLADSDGGTLLTLDGYQPTSPPPSNVNAIPQRYDVTFDSSGNQTLGATYNAPNAATSTNTSRAAATFDGDTYYFSDQGGLYSNNEYQNTGTYSTDALEAIKPFGSTMYEGSKSTPGAVEIVPSATSTSLTALTGIGADSRFADFYMVSSGNNGSTYDVMYTLDTNGAINKFFSSNGTTWTAAGSYTGLSAGARMAAVADGSGAGYTGSTLYVTNDAAGTADNSLLALTDNSAWNANINITTASNTTLYTATGTNTLFGVAFVPTTTSTTLTTAAVPTYTPNIVGTGGSVTFTDVVTASEGSSAPTTGSVQFYGYNGTNGTLLATATSGSGNGNAATFTVTTSSIPNGIYSTIYAAYVPGSGFTASASSPTSGTLLVGATTTTTATPTFTPAIAQSNQPVTFSTTVTANSGSTAPPAGSVEFVNGTGANEVVLATATSETTNNTVATFTVSTVAPVGSYNDVYAIYSGSGSFAGSTSGASGTTLTVNPVSAPAGAIAQWVLDNDAVGTNLSPAPSYGAGVATALGMTNDYNGVSSTNGSNIVLGASGDTGANGLADLTNVFRVVGGASGSGNGWSSFAPIGSQGAEFATSTLNDGGPVTITFDWYATTQGEANMMLEYTDDANNASPTWNNLKVTVPSGEADVAAIDNTNASDTNTVQGWYVQLTNGQDWAQGLTASITDPNAVNNPNFAIEMVNASTGADDVNTTGGALNNTSGNWRFDNVTFQAQTPNFTPGNLVELQAGNSTNTYSQGPVYLDEVTPTGASVQQIGVSASSGAAGIAAATESGTTITITTATTALYAVGESISLSGIVSGSGSGASDWDIAEPVATVISPTQFTIQGPANLPAITSLSGALATPPNQPLTVALNQAVGNAQLNRSYDGSALTFNGVDSATEPTSNGSTAYSTDDRDLAVVSGNPNYPSDINTSTYGAWNGGDDNRDSVAESAYGPIYQAGHNNDVSGFPSYVGVHAFSTEGGPSLGTQVSAASNIRGVTIGPDNREYFSTAAGVSSVSDLAGIFTDASALPASGSTTPTQDIEVVPSLITNDKLNGVYIADMNGTGVISNGDRLYFVSDGSEGGEGTGGLFVATWNTSNDYPWNTPNNAGAAAAGIQDFWGVPVRLGDAPTQSGTTAVGTMVGVTGTVLSLNNGNTPGTVELYTTAFDNTANDSSIVQQWMDAGSGVTITDAKQDGSGNVTITTSSPNNFANNEYVTVDGIGTTGGSSYAITGATDLTSGYNGTWQITVINSTTFTYSDTNSNASTLSEVTNAGGVGSANAAITSDLSQASTYQSFGIGINNNNSGNYNNLSQETFGGTIVQTLADGTETVGTKTVAQEGLRGVAFAPVAATSIVLADSGHTLTATLTNNQVPPSGQVAFINENTGAVLGFGTISSTAPYTATLADSAVVGDAYVEAYFAGGGTLALAPAQSNIIQVANAGTTSDSVSVSANPTSVAVNKSVTLTATITPSTGPTGNVSFYNGSVSLSNLLGTVALTGNTASLTTEFGSTGTLTITAVYNGDATYESNSNTTTVNVAANATAAITSSANPAPINTAPSYTVTLTGNSTLGTPTGTVTVTIVSATNNTSGKPAISTTSASITLTAGSGNTATAVWNSSNATPPPSLTDGGSYLVTMTYTPGSGSGYSGFSITPESSGANYTNTALIENVDQAFTPGNLVLVQRGDGSVNTGSSGGLVEVDEYTPSGTEVQSIILPNSPTGSNNTFVLGSQNGSQGLVSRSYNGADLTLIGYDTELGTQFLTSSFPYTIPRTIAEIGSGGAGTVNTTTAITSTSPTAVPFEQEDVVSNNGSQFWIVSSLPTGDTTDSGIEYVSSVGATTATQLTSPGTTGAALTIAGGQLYDTSGSGNVNTIGTGLPTSATATITGLPNLQNEYQKFYNTAGSSRNPEQVLLLNTTDGTTNNPNVAYVADQDYGLLKFYLNDASISLSSSGTTATATVTSGTLSFLGNGNDQVQITGAPGYNGTYTLPASAISGQSFTFTLPNGGSNLSSASGTAGQWLNGTNGNGTFGEKLVFAGGATGVNGYVTFSGGNYTGVQLYVTGANVQGLNPNLLASLTDTNAPSGGFPSGNFNQVAVVGASGQNGGTSNANADFAGMSFVPGYTTNTTLASNLTNVQYNSSTQITYTATVTSTGSSDTPAGTVLFYNGSTLLATEPLATVSGHQEASFSTSAAALGLPVGSYTITATYNPGGQELALDDMSSGFAPLNVDYTAGDLIVSQVGATYSAGISTIAVSGTTTTVTTSAANSFITGQAVTITGSSVSGDNSATASYTIKVTNSTTFTFTTPTGFASASGGTATLALDGLATATSLLDYSDTGTLNSGNTVNLPDAGTTVAITAASWASNVATITAANNFSANQTVIITGMTPAAYNGTYTIASATATSFTYTLTLSSSPGAGTVFGAASVGSAGDLTEIGTATKEGYLADSSDGETAEIGGYSSAANGTTTGANGVVGVLSPDGSINTSTQIPNAEISIGTSDSVKAVASPDGLGFYVATNQFIQYVPFGNSGTTPTTTVQNFFTANDGTSGGFQSSQSPSDVVIGDGQLYGDAGSEAQTDGVPAADGPFSVGSGLPTTAGQSATVFSGPSTGESGTPAQFLTSEQFAVSPTGLTFFIADARTNGEGGLYEWQISTNNTTIAQVASYTFATTGLTGLTVNWSNPSDPIVYAVTTNANTGYSGNTIVSFQTTDNESGGTGSISTPATLATAPANESFRGVALAPVAPGTANSTTTLSVTNNSGQYSQVTLSAAVTGSSPTGYVSFQDNGVEIGSAPLINGTATLTPDSNLLAGSYSSDLTAVYTGDVNNAPSTSSAVSATVAKYSTFESVTDSGNGNANTGTPDTLIDTLQVPAGTDPTGTVQFYDDGTAIGSPATISEVISGGAISFTTSISYQFPVADGGTTQNITASYSGDSNFAAISQSFSPTDPIVVINASTTVVTSNAQDPSGNGGTVIFTATVTGNSSAGVPAGTVQFYINGIAIGSPVAVQQVNGSNDSAFANLTQQTASLTETAPGTLTPGVDSVTAVFAPSSSPAYAASNGALNQTVKGVTIAAGDSLVYQTGDTTSTYFSAGENIVYIDEYNPSTDALLQQFVMPSVTSNGYNAFTEAGSNGSGEWVNQTSSGNGFVFGGVDSPVGSAGGGSAVIAFLSDTGTLTDNTVDTTNTGSTLRSVASVNGSSFYEGDSNGVYYITAGTTGAPTALITSLTPRNVKISNGNLYVSSDSAAEQGVSQVGTGLPTTTGQTLTPIAIFTSAQQTASGFGPYDFFFATLQSGDTSPDTLYVVADEAGIYKYTLSGTTWSFTTAAPLNATATNEYGGLSGSVVNGVATLYATDDIQFSAATGGNIVSITDNSGYGGTGFASATATLIASSPTNTNWHGAAAAAVTTQTVVTSNTTSAAASGASVLFTATVTSTNATPAQTPTTGTVQFYDGLIPIGSPVAVNSSGVAQLTVTTNLLQRAGAYITPGINTITAVYSGDFDGDYNGSSGFAGSTSAQINQVVKAQAFGAGDQFTYQVGGYGASLGNSNGSAVWVDEVTHSGTVLQQIAMPTADAAGTDGNYYRALVQFGRAPSNPGQLGGQLTVSGNGQYAFLAGYDDTPTSTSSPGTDNSLRTIARIDFNGNVTTETINNAVVTTGSFQSLITGIYSPDGNRVYLSGIENFGIDYLSSWQPGVTTVAATPIVAVPTADFANFTGLESIGNTLYVGVTTATTSAINEETILQVGTAGTLPTGTVAFSQSGLPSLLPSVTHYFVDMYFTSPTTMYASYESSSSTEDYDLGGISKYAFVSGAWTLQGSTLPAAPTPNNSDPTGGTPGFFYLSGSSSSGTVTLYESYNNEFPTTATSISGDIDQLQDTNSGTQGFSSTTVTVINSQSGTGGVSIQYHGISAVPINPTVSTTTSLTLNGISAATAGLAIETGYSPTVTVQVTPASGSQSALNGDAVDIFDTSISGDPMVGTGNLNSSGSVTITLNTTGSGNLLQTGTNNLVATFPAVTGYSTSSSSTQNQAINSLFELDTFTQTATGFTGTFDGIVNTSLLSDYTNSSSATPSVTLSNGSTAVPGSVVFDAADTQLTFVATNTLSGSTLLSGILAPGATYTPLLSGVASNTQAFQDTLGDAFAGNGSSAGTNYNTNFTSSNTSTATTVWVPYVARGYSQPVNVPASSSSGLPIYITIPSGGSALTSATFTFNYNPALLNVTAAAVDSSISSNFTGSFTINQAAGTVAVTLTANSGKNLAAGATYTVADLTATVQTTATYKDKEVLNLTNININGGTNNGQDGSQVHVAAFVDNANAVTQSSSEPTTIPSAYSGQDAFDMLSVAGSSSSTILHNVYKMLDPTVLGDDANSGHATAQAAHDTLVVAGGGTVANIPELPNVITAATESSTTVTITTFEALPLTVGEKVTVAGVNVNGYNGSNLTVTGVSGNTFTYTDSTSGLGNSSGGDVSIPNPVGGPDPTIYLSPTLATTAGGTVTLTVYLLVNNSGGLLYDSDDVAIRFDASRFTASNLSAPSSGDPDFSSSGNNLSLSGAINNSNGTITFSEFTNNTNGVQLANGSLDAIATITFTVDSNAPVGVASIHLAQQIGTHTTDVNGGNATLNPAPNDGAPPLSGDPSGIPYQASTDTDFSIVAQSGAITIPNASGSTNQPVTVPIVLTAGPGGFTYDSDDVAIHFNPAELQASSLSAPSSGDPDFSVSGNNLSLSGSINNTTGVITFSEFTNNTNGVVLAAGAVDEIATITFTPLSSANLGGTSIHLAVQEGTHTTDINGGNIEVSPAPDDSTSDYPSLANDSGTGIAYDPNTDGKFTVSVNPEQPPYDSLPTAAQIASSAGGVGVLFNPAAGVPGLQTASANSLGFNAALGDPITVVDSTYPTNPIATVSESGNTVTVTTSGPNIFTASDTVDISGVSVSGYNGTFPIASIVSGNQFTYTDSSSGLSAGSGGNATAYNTGSSGGPANPYDTTTLTLTGTGAAGSTGLVGTLTAIASGAASISGSGTAASPLVIEGSPTDITNTLQSLVYTPGSGFWGTTTLTVSTNDNGNNDYGGPLTDTRSTSITVVGLFESTVNLTANTPVTANVTGASAAGTTITLTLNSVSGFAVGQQVIVNTNHATINGTFSITAVTGSTIKYVITGSAGTITGTTGTAETVATSKTQYLTVFSTVDSYPVPSGVYVVGINGQQNSAGAAPGAVEDYFALGGLTTGTNGYLTLLESGAAYTSETPDPVVNSITYYTNSGSGAGFGSSTSVGTSNFDNIGYHDGPTLRTGIPESPLDMEQGSVSYLLIKAPSAPTIGGSIDGGSTSSATVAGGSMYNSWNVMDGVGILRNANGTGGPDRSYAPTTFVSSSNTTGTVIASSYSIPTGSWTASFVARIAQLTGPSDWLGSVLTPSSTGGQYTLSASDSTAFAGQAVDNINGPNYWAPNQTVVVNDGSSTQHSQVSEITIDYNEPVSIADLTSDYQILDSNGNPLSINVNDSNGASNLSGDEYNIIGLSESGYAVTVTLDPNDSATDYTQGQYATMNGILNQSGAGVAGYDGEVLITSVAANGYSFTFNAANQNLPTITPVESGGLYNDIGFTNSFAASPVSDSGVTSVVISFNAVNIEGASSDAFTYANGMPDQLSNSAALNNGNYFLHTVVADIANNGIALDGAHNGIGGSTTPNNSSPPTSPYNGQGVYEVDEFWRLYGDVSGNRSVDGIDLTYLRNANESSSTNSSGTLTVTAASESNNTVTLTTSGSTVFLVGEYVTLGGFTGNAAAYNGVYGTIASVSGNTVTLTTITAGLPSVSGANGTATLNAYEWYLDANGSGNIDDGNTTSESAFLADMYTTLNQ